MAYQSLTSKTLSWLYGVHETGNHLQFHAKLATADTDLLPGSVVRLTDDLEFAAGVGTDNVMPLILFSHPGEPDVNPELPDPSTDVDAWVPMALPGEALAFPCSGGFEFVSTAFVAGAYTPNTPLTADKTGADKGLLQAGTIGTDMIVGFVSRGVVNNGYNTDGLAFWTFPVFPG